MNTSDFLTLLGLAIAVWSIIPKQERSFYVLFFSKREIYLIGFVFIFYLHFLISFDWLIRNWWPWLSVFTYQLGIPANIYAYIISILIIAYMILSISLGFFSRSRVQDAISYYRTLIDKNEIDLLTNYINKYHIQDIYKFNVDYSKIPPKEARDIVLRRRTKQDEDYESLISQTRSFYAVHVCDIIVKDEEYISMAANHYPELFATVIFGMESEEASDKDFVQSFIGVIFASKNQKLIQELKILSERGDSILEVSKTIDIPIMRSLMVHTRVAAANYVWYPVAEETKKALKYDKEQTEFLCLPYDSQIQDKLWNYKIYIAIHYFNSMVRETIYRDSGWHMWLFMYDRFVSAIISNVPDDVVYEVKSEYPSFNHYLISKIVSNMTDWIDLAVDLNTKGQTVDTCRCLGEVLMDIAKAAESKLSAEFKSSQFESVLDIYFSLSNHKNEETAEFSRDYIENVFRNPKNPDWHEPDVTPAYCNVLKSAWEDFDKVPYEDMEENGSISRFTEKVLVPLDLTL